MTESFMSEFECSPRAQEAEAAEEVELFRRALVEIQKKRPDLPVLDTEDHLLLTLDGKLSLCLYHN
jgi:hypothetical protein